MIIKTYIKYILKNYLQIILKITFIFYSLVFLLSVFEEINFFKDIEPSFLYPMLLTFLNTPSILYNIFPFIFLIATQLFFLEIFEKNELVIYKNFGLSNYKILKILTFGSFIFALFIIIIFYNVSSKLKNFYLEYKNNYTTDNKYLAVITENGLWIKDEIDKKIIIINADSIQGHYLKNVSITEFSNKFVLTRNIEAKKVDIKDTTWLILNATLHQNNLTKNINEISLNTHFNLEKIKNLFSNLSSLTIWELLKLREDYKSLGYSTLEIDMHKHKIIAYPVFLMIMTLLSGIIMLNIKMNKTKIFHLILGISMSVIIYYIRFFFNLLGENGKFPVVISVWFPLIILLIFSIIGLVRINEK